MSDFFRNLLDRFATTDGIAISAGQTRWSYSQLLNATTRINGYLGEFQNQQIALYAGKSYEAYAGIYAILLSGNCWIPMEPATPPARSLEMLKLCQPAAILADAELPAELLNYARRENIPVKYLSELAADGIEREFEPTLIDEDHVAYIMFTSGSTGQPKGVPVSHRNYINFVENTMPLLPFHPGKVFADYHDFGFDLSIFYLFCCPLSGGTLAPAQSETDRILPLTHMRRNRVSVLISVPSLLTRLMAYLGERPAEYSVPVIVMAGEPFRLDQLEFCYRALGAQHVFNFYGLTETGVENFYHPCSPEDVQTFAEIGYVPIGQPLANNQVRLTAEGELLLSGVQLTSDYLGGVGTDKFFQDNGATWFRTGDRVVIEQNQYFCKGRFDNQVKINGYRIELMDIEAHARRLPGVNDAVCFVEKAGAREFLTLALSGNHVPDLEAAATFLRPRLPTYMIPQRLVALDAMPLNSSGKIDRTGLRRQFGLAP